MQHTMKSTGNLKRQKVKPVSANAMYAYKRNKKYVPLVLKIGDRWRSLVDIRPRPLYFRKRSPVPTEWEAVGLQRRLDISEKRKLSCFYRDYGRLKT